MAKTQLKPMSPQDESTWFKVRVEMKINAMTSDFAKEITYHVHRGVVTLQGKVPSPEAVKAAERVANSLPDVLGVVNNLTVAS